VLVWRASPWKIPSGFTWIIWRDWNYNSHFGWLLTDPIVAIGDAGSYRNHAQYFLTFAGVWAGLVTLLNDRWFVQQFRHFRPYATLARGEQPLAVSAAQGATTRTAGKPSAVD
jgi:hypothetical protein